MNPKETLNQLFEIKLAIQKLETDIAKEQKKWMEAGKKVSSYSQLKGEMIRKLLKGIKKI